MFDNHQAVSVSHLVVILPELRYSNSVTIEECLAMHTDHLCPCIKQPAIKRFKSCKLI